MTLQLPSHVQGWKIPATDRSPELTVVRAGSPWGPHYEVGTLNVDWTKMEPRDAKAWLVEGDTRTGMAFMDIAAEGRGRRWADGHRGVAALLHFCVQADGPEGTGYIPEDGVLYVPHITREKSDPGDIIYLRGLGFSAVHDARYGEKDLVADPARIRAITAEAFPEFALAEELPHRTADEEMALAALQTAQPVTE
jgi:hypothetical protein